MFSFNSKNEFTRPHEPITVNTIVVYQPGNGKVVHEWGNGTFFMPHGIAVDPDDNIWVTDVAMHQASCAYNAKHLQMTGC